jgi:alpha-mannosidase
VREGRWDLTGGFEVECDSILPCGEALARCLAIGQRQFLERTGSYSTLAWLPDAFGFSNALPQILALGGVTRFYTTKLTWSAVHRFPYNSFVWRGADGSEVLAHSCSSIYNQMVEAEALCANLDDHRQVDVHPEMLVCVGWGDGGGGTSEDQIERARRFADLAGMPKVRWSGSGAFFDRLDAVRHRLPYYQGELYLEGTRGCFTTQGEFKRLYRRAETALQTHEAVRAALGGAPLDEQPWRRVSFLQFHDALPGSSIRAVYDQAGPELQAIGDHALAAATAELAAAAAPGGGTVVFNPLPVPRREVVELPRAAIPPLAPAQDAGCDRALVLLDLPALGTARPDAALAPAQPVAASAGLLDNGRLRAVFDQAGRLTALSIDGRPQRLEGSAGLALYEDVPGSFDAWEIDQAAGRLGQRLATQAPLTVASAGPLRGVLRGHLLVGSSPATIEYRLDAEARHLRVRLRIDWREEHRLLRFHLPTGHRGRFARFGAPFGSTLRPQLPGLQADEAMWEVPGSRWAAVTDDDGTGLALLAAARYGFSCRDGDLALSLLRRPCYPAVGNDPVDSGEFTDGGCHDLEFALGAHAAGTALAADTLFTPPLTADHGRDLTAPFQLLDLGSLTPSWVLPAAGGGLILRLHETAGASGRASLVCPGATVEAVDFLERVVGGSFAQDTDGMVAVPYRPYQVLGLRIRIHAG